MTIETVRDFLGICSLINIGILLLWFLMISKAHDWLYNFHTKWFKLSEERFDEIHYSAMAFYKLSFYLFNIVPYFALLIMS